MSWSEPATSPRKPSRRLINVSACLDAAGATFADVAKTVIYVVDWDDSKMEHLIAGFGRAAQRLGGAPLAPATLVSVAQILREGFLIELDVTAVIS